MLNKLVFTAKSLDFNRVALTIDIIERTSEILHQIAILALLTVNFNVLIVEALKIKAPQHKCP